ncbi:MAG: T9SS type A sorting domain-containing protein, partial [Bacteroidota bacterium]
IEVDGSILTGVGNFTINTGGIGVTTNNEALFDPSVGHDNVNGPNSQFAPQSEHRISFSYTDGIGCLRDTSLLVYVNPLPEIVDNEIKSASTCATGDVKVFVEMEPNEFGQGKDAYNFVWEVNGNQVQNSDGTAGGDTLVFDFAGSTSANFSVFVTYIGTGSPSDYTTNCQSSIISQSISVGLEPQPALSWVGITEGRQTSFQLTEESPALANGNVNYLRVVIDGVEAFEDFTPDLTVPYEFDYVFATSGTHMIEVEMGTNAGCQVNVSRNIEILGHLSGFNNLSSYSESFENGLGGWLIETVSIDGKSDDLPSTWTRTNAIPGAGGVDGSFAVITDNYQPSEVSFVYSPSIDLSGFASPTISFLRLVQFETFRDGVAFQISTDDGRTWENVGNFSLEFGSSPGWYNFEGITSAPGTVAPGPQAIASNNRQIGWTDQESDVWIEAKEAISVLAAEADSVRFRFALAAQAGDKSVTGFGFDNVTIFDRDRIVLIEQFSSSLSASSISLNNRLDSTTTFIGTDVIRINYFTDLANTDTEQDGLNLRNTVDPGARSVLYGIDQASSVAIAGEASFLDPNVEDSWLTAVTQLGNAKLGNPRFRISISAAIVDNNINLGASFESLSNFTDPNTELSLNLAIIEPEVILTEAMGLYNAGDRVNNVMRQMLPDAAGEYRSGTIAAGDVLEISEITWPITGVFNPDTLTIVAFIQDINTNEIYQSAITGVSGGENVLSVNENLLSDIVVYPNPGDEQVTIDFINPLKKDSEWVLYDQSGRTMKKGDLSKGHQQLLLDTKEAASGMYFFYLFQSNEPAAAVRLMIRH